METGRHLDSHYCRKREIRCKCVAASTRRESRPAPLDAAASSSIVTPRLVFLSFRRVRRCCCSCDDPSTLDSKVGDVEDILVAYDGKESKLCKGLIDR